MNDHLQLFCSIGLNEKKAEETLKNGNLSSRLLDILKEAAKYGSYSENGMLYYHLASKIKPTIENRIPFLVKNIAGRKLNNPQQVDAALQYFMTQMKKDIDQRAFEEYCGVGIVVTSEEIEQLVEEVIENYRSEIIEKRYRFNSGYILREVRDKLKWADGRIVKNEVDLQVLYILCDFTITSVSGALHYMLVIYFRF